MALVISKQPSVLPVFAAVLFAGCGELFANRPESESASPTSTTQTHVEVTQEPVENVPEPEAEPAPAPAQQAEPSAPVEPGVSRNLSETRGRLPKAAIEAGIARGQAAVQACYEPALAQNSALKGTITVNFVIAPDGTVPSAAALESATDFPDSSVIECVLSSFAKLSFDKPAGGRVVVTYPVRLEPKAANSGAEPK